LSSSKGNRKERTIRETLLLSRLFLTGLDPIKNSGLDKRMKGSLLYVFLSAAVTISFAKMEPDLDDSGTLKKILKLAITTLKEKDLADGSTKYFIPGEEVPFSGWQKQLRKDGEVRSLEQFLDGQSHGLYRYWWKNGKKSQEKNHDKGVAHGLWTSWYDNGQKQLEQWVRHGKLHGPAKRWYRNGNKKDHSFYENGRIINLEVWKPSGVKCPHTKVVNGNGVWVRYEEDGSEAWRSDYRNGLFILKK